MASFLLLLKISVKLDDNIKDDTHKNHRYNGEVELGLGQSILTSQGKLPNQFNAFGKNDKAIRLIQSRFR